MDNDTFEQIAAQLRCSVISQRTLRLWLDELALRRREIATRSRLDLEEMETGGALETAPTVAPSEPPRRRKILRLIWFSLNGIAPYSECPMSMHCPSEFWTPLVWLRLVALATLQCVFLLGAPCLLTCTDFLCFMGQFIWNSGRQLDYRICDPLMPESKMIIMM